MRKEKRKKREAERRELDGIERNYKKIKRQTVGLKTEVADCGAQYGNLVTDIQRMLDLWRHRFDGLLNGDRNTDEVEPHPHMCIRSCAEYGI